MVKAGLHVTEVRPKRALQCIGTAAPAENKMSTELRRHQDDPLENNPDGLHEGGFWRYCFDRSLLPFLRCDQAELGYTWASAFLMGLGLFCTAAKITLLDPSYLNGC